MLAAEVSLTLATAVSIKTGLALLFCSFLLLFTPGFLLVEVCFRRDQMSWPARILSSFLLSMSMLIILGTVVLAINGTLVLLLGLILALEAALLITALLARRRRSAMPGAPTDADRALPRANPWLLGIFGLVSLAVILRFLMPIGRPFVTGDFWSYLGLVRKWATWGPRPALNAFLGTPVVPGAFRYVFGGWMLSQSLLSTVSGFDALDISAWWIPFLLLTSSFASIYYLGRALFQNRNAAILSALAFLLHIGSSIDGLSAAGRIAFYRINEDKFLLPLVTVPMATFFMIRYLHHQRKGDLVCLLVSLLALPLTHPLGLVEAGLTFGFFGALHLLFKHDRKTITHLAAIFLPMIALLFIPLSERLLLSTDNPTETGAVQRDRLPYGINNPTAANLAERGYSDRILILDAERNRYITHPAMLRYPITVAALALTPLLIFFAKRHMGVRYLLGNMVGLVAILFMPWLAPLLGRVITPWGLWRLVYLLPSSLVMGFLLDQLAGSLQRWLQRRESRLASLAPLLSLVVMGGAAAMLAWQGIYQWPQVTTVIGDGQEIDLLLAARSFIQEPSTVMYPRPDRVGIALPGMIQNGYVPTWHGNHIFQGTVGEVAAFYDAEGIDATSWDALQRHGCDFVILNKTLLSPLLLPSSLLELLYANEDYAFLRVAQVAPDHPLIRANTRYARGEWAEAASAYQEAMATDPLYAMLRLADMQHQQGYVDKARQSYTEAAQRFPESPWPHLYLAQFERLNGDPEVALASFRKTLETCDSDPLFPTSAIDSLERIDKSWKQVLTTAFATEDKRWGAVYGSDAADLSADQVAMLGIGWFTTNTIQMIPSRVADHVNTIVIPAAQFLLPQGLIDRAIVRRRGAIWLIGLWPESAIGGNRTPDEYAVIYHDIYRYIKSQDLAATVAPGGILAATPARLQWISAVMDAYEARFHSRLPADAWHINAFPLPDMGPPPGIDAVESAFGPADHVDAALFQRQIFDFRQWMADHGERKKPLILSGMGGLLPMDQVGQGDAAEGERRVTVFMTEAFDFLRSATDQSLGYPADGNRLVQRWAWSSLVEDPYDPITGQGTSSPLFAAPGSGAEPALTSFGRAFADYTRSQPD